MTKKLTMIFNKVKENVEYLWHLKQNYKKICVEIENIQQTFSMINQDLDVLFAALEKISIGSNQKTQTQQIHAQFPTMECEEINETIDKKFKIN